MNIITDYPPNFDEIKKHFQISPGTVFTYGSAIYNPSAVSIPLDLLAHEMVHEKQQGKDPQKWWDTYIDDPKFRVLQEIEAYQAQYLKVKGFVKDRNKVAVFLHKIAGDLSSGLYGEAIDYWKAFEAIKAIDKH